MAVELQTIIRGAATQRLALGEGRTRLPARPGSEYKIVDEALKGLNGTSVKRVDNSLVIEGLPDGRSVEFDGFFTACAPSGASSCSVSIAETGSTVGPITPVTEPIAALPDGSFLLYGGAHAGGPTAVSAPIAAAADNSWKAIGAGLGGLAIAGLAVGAGGGGGGESAQDTTAPAPPAFTSKASFNALAPVFTGTAEPGSRVLLRIDLNRNGNPGDAGDVTFETLTLADGTWRIPTADQAPLQGTWTGGLVDGQSYIVSAIARDQAGNLSGATNTTVAIDATAPVAPTVSQIGGDGVVNRAESLAGVTVSGTGEAGSTVTVTWGSAAKTGTVAANGAWSVVFGTADLPQSQGASVVSTSLTDAAGNVSRTTSQVVVIDTTGPLAPVVSNGALTNLALPTFTGTAEANTKVRVSVDLAGDGSIDAVYETTASATGAWSVNTQAPAPGTTLVSGSMGTGLTDKVGVTLVQNTLSVVAVDAAGNSSAATSATIALDSTAPGAPVINAVAGDDIVNIAERGTVTITGTVPAESSGQPVTVTWGATTRIVTATGTTWSAAFTIGEIPADGAAAVTAVSQSATGVAGVLGTRNVTVDGTQPAAPSVTLTAASDSGTLGDNITNDTTPTVRVALNGTGASAPVAGDVVRLTVGGTQVGTATLSAGNIGADFVDITTSALAAGSRTIAATVTDLAGNASSAGNLTLTIDTAAPGAPVPTLTAASNSGSTADLITNDPTPTIRVDFTGASVGDTVTLTVGGSTVGTATLSGGDVAATFVEITTSTLAAGSRTISATLTNSAGNVSPAGTVTLTIDTTAPLAPTVALTAGSDTGTAGDFITLDTTPTFRIGLNGTGATAPVDGDTVTLTVGGLTVGTATLTTTDITNDFVNITTSTLTASASPQTVSATIQDVAGNTSTAGTLNVTISNDATPPAPPTLALAPVSDTGTTGDGITNDTTPVIRVTFAGAGATAPVEGDFVQLTVGGAAAGTATLNATHIGNGYVDITSTVALANGVATTVGATIRDIPGNTSTAGTATITADTSPPAALVAGTDFTFSIVDDLTVAFDDIESPITTGTATNPDTSPLVTFDLINPLGAGESIVISRSTLGGALANIFTVTATGSVSDNATLASNTGTAEAYVYQAEYFNAAGNKTQLDLDGSGLNDGLYVIRVA